MFLIPDSWYKIKNLKKKGRGVFALKDIPAGTVIGDYIGILIPFDTADERRDGLFDMAGGSKYDILGDPKKEGIQLINHSCANNCDMYPYRGHMLYFALRKIFKGEELTVNYALSTIEDDMPCGFHACHCGSKFCRGTMHDSWTSFDAWDALVKKESGMWRNKVPGKYGEEIAPLVAYPAEITRDYPAIYNLYASENKPALRCDDAKLPPVSILRKRIRETGRQLSFPKLRLRIHGMTGATLITTLI